MAARTRAAHDLPRAFCRESPDWPTMLGGILGVVSPYLLGSLADHLGLHTAFAVEPALLGACALLLLAGVRLTRRESATGVVRLG